MAVNRGKKFEYIIKQAFEKVPDVSIDRLHDQTTRFKGSQNICDFVVYKKPYQYYIECKSVHGNILPFTNITDTQWKGLLKKSKIDGVIAGVICWWVDKNMTRFLPIQALEAMKADGLKSVSYVWDSYFYGQEAHFMLRQILGKKKRVFFDYNTGEFFNEVQFDKRRIDEDK